MPSLNKQILISQLRKCETNISWCYDECRNNAILDVLNKEKTRLMALIQSLEFLLSAQSDVRKHNTKVAQSSSEDSTDAGSE